MYEITQNVLNQLGVKKIKRKSKYHETNEYGKAASIQYDDSDVKEGR